MAVELGTLSTRTLLDTLAPSSEAAVQGTPSSEKEELRDLCEQMEGVFTGILMRQMRQTIWENDFLPEGPGEDMFRSLYELEVGQRMAQRSGLGIADALYMELERTGEWQRQQVTRRSS